MSQWPIVRIEHIETRFEPWAWPFAINHRSEIDAHFAELQRRKPAVWNGRVLLLRDHAIEGTVLRGVFFETDYAAFTTWRQLGCPGENVKDCFPLGALCCEDGFLLGVMAEHTVNAGQIYFPAGTPDPNDIVGDSVDLAAAVRREVTEETGLLPDDFVAEDGWHCVLAGSRIALVKVLRVRGTTDRLRNRILNNLAQEEEPELVDMRIVRGGEDLDPMMPGYVTAFLNGIWRRRHEGE